MKKLTIALTALLLTAISGNAGERSYTITFGGSTSTTSLTNDNFRTAITSGAAFVESVTSVVAIFPEGDAIRMSSSKTDGKFNIHIAPFAQVEPSRVEVEACRYDNNRDADAWLMFNNYVLVVESVTPEKYGYTPVAHLGKMTNLIVDATKRVYIRSITVYYDDAQGIVTEPAGELAAPVITPAGGWTVAGGYISISAADTAAAIHYTTDGSTPTAASAMYTEPLIASETVTVKAIAVSDGKSSPLTTATIDVRPATDEVTATFDFSNVTSLIPATAEPTRDTPVLLDGLTFTEGPVALSFTAADYGNTHARLYASYDAGTDLRLYDGDIATVTTLVPDYSITAMKATISASGSNSDVWFVPSQGEWIWEQDSWSPEGLSDITAVDLTSYQQSRLASLSVTLTREGAGIENISAGDTAAPRYYTLTGIPVATPDNGIYVHIHRGKASRILIR